MCAFSFQRALFFENYGPNYHASFEVILTTSTEEVTLMVEDPDRAQVWVHSLHLPGKDSATQSITEVLKL